MEKLDLIYAAIIAALPTIVSVLSIIFAVVKQLKSFGELKEQCNHQPIIDELQRQIIAMHTDNEALRKEVRRLTEEISHVKTNEVE